MRRIACWLVVFLLVALPAAAQTAPASAESENTILGMSYGTAALAAAGAVAGAIALNTVVAPNVGTAVFALWLAHWVVQGAVIYGAGSYLGWWDEEEAVTGQPVRLLKD